MGARQLSIKRRSTLFAAGVATLLSTLLAALLMIAVQRLATRWLTEELVVAGGRVAMQVERGQIVGYPLALHPSRNVQVVDARSRVVASTPQMKGQPAMARFTPHDQRVATSIVCNGVFNGQCNIVAAQWAHHGQDTFVVYSASPVIPPWVDPQLAAVVGGGAVLLTAGITLLGRRLTAVSLRPVIAIRAELDEINATSPGRRVPVPRTDDEIQDLADSVNRTLSQLEAALQRERQMVSDVSHDLRTPITAMRTQVEVALAAPRETSVTALGSTLLGSLDRIWDILNDLLTLAALDAGAELSQKRLDLAQFTERECRIRHAAKTIECMLEPGVMVIGDQSRLCRLLTNLVDNAFRHAESVVTISVRRESSGDSFDQRFRHGVAVLEVLDDGAGIDPTQREKVFHRFTRLDAARARDLAGSGLGLAIARQIAEMHGGSLGIEDSPRGARFVLRLPLAETASTPATDAHQ
ncbi:sensor histidine kinase [Microbispora corallina]|nr:HAMP domain-containing sensor histidine kinase [Microbispora corallina]